jgi:hypothetical protein
MGEMRNVYGVFFGNAERGKGRNATSGKVAGSIPDEVVGFFQMT